MRTARKMALVAVLLVGTAGAQAALVNRGGGLIYDSTRNITWLADMNYAKTSGFDADGLMTWSAATTWANNLVHGGFSDWRLPTLNPADTSCSGGVGVGSGYNCNGGELSGLFVTGLGNKAIESVLNQVGDTPEQNANLGMFSNVQSSYYWSDTQYALNGNFAWSFNTSNGDQTVVIKTFDVFAIAVRDGDVASTVPEPQTLALALAALGATVVTRRRAAVKPQKGV